MGKKKMSAKEAEEFGERLTKKLEDKSIRQSDLARYLGVTPQAVQRMCAGLVQNPGYILEISDFLDVDPFWLRSGHFKERLLEQDSNLMVMDAIIVPLVSLSRLNSYESIDLIFMDKSLTKIVIADPSSLGIPNRNLFAVECDNNSMLPTIANGNQLVFSSEINPVPEELVLCKSRDNQFCVREFRENYPGYTLHAHNKAFSDEDVGADPAQDRIVAVAVFELKPLLKR